MKRSNLDFVAFLAIAFMSLLLLGAAKRNDQILGGDSMKFVVLLIVAAGLIVGAFLLGSRLRTGEQALELEEVKAQNLKLLDEKAVPPAQVAPCVLAMLIVPGVRFESRTSVSEISKAVEALFPLALLLNTSE